MPSLVGMVGIPPGICLPGGYGRYTLPGICTLPTHPGYTSPYHAARCTAVHVRSSVGCR